MSVAAGRIASEQFAATVHAAGSTVSNGDIERVLAAGSRHSLREGRVVLHSLPIGYVLDDARGIRDPRGMLGKRLGVDMHVVTADVAAAVIDIGAGTTAIAVFHGGHFVHTDAFAVGGQHVTMDLARGLAANV